MLMLEAIQGFSMFIQGRETFICDFMVMMMKLCQFIYMKCMLLLKMYFSDQYQTFINVIWSDVDICCFVHCLVDWNWSTNNIEYVDFHFKIKLRVFHKTNPTIGVLNMVTIEDWYVVMQ
jgi:hypothetical protein